MKQFSKIAGFQGIKRDELTRRATIQTKRYQCLVSPFLSINLSTQLPINRILLPHVFVKSPTNIPPPTLKTCIQNIRIPFSAQKIL